MMSFGVILCFFSSRGKDNKIGHFILFRPKVNIYWISFACLDPLIGGDFIIVNIQLLVSLPRRLVEFLNFGIYFEIKKVQFFGLIKKVLN